MKLRIFATVLSALLFSAIFTFKDFSKQGLAELGYDDILAFFLFVLVVFIYSVPGFILLGIPFSMLMDKGIEKINAGKFLSKIVQTSVVAIMYTFGGFLAGILYLIGLIVLGGEGFVQFFRFFSFQYLYYICSFSIPAALIYKTTHAFLLFLKNKGA